MLSTVISLTGGELFIGDLGRVPKEEYSACDAPVPLLKDSLEFKNTICTKKTARCHCIGVLWVMSSIKAP